MLLRVMSQTTQAMGHTTAWRRALGRAYATRLATSSRDENIRVSGKILHVGTDDSTRCNKAHEWHAPQSAMIDG